MNKRLKSIVDQFPGKKIMVIGDLMLDRYLWGQVSRLSPEAPVPIVEIHKTHARLGGAANVGHNINALGAATILVGVVGDDQTGRELRAIVEENGMGLQGIIEEKSRPTTEKTRVIAKSQHVVRTDFEARDSIQAKTHAAVREVVSRHIDSCDAVIFEDYDKGLIDEALISFVVEAAREAGKIVCVDPKFDHFFAYSGVTVFKPNRRETEEILGVRLTGRTEIVASAKTLLKKLSCQCALITLGEDGMAVYDGRDEVHFIPTKARKVADVSGAGDTTIATLTLALTAGASYVEAATLANLAAGIVCGEVGIVPISTEKLLNGI